MSFIKNRKIWLFLGVAAIIVAAFSFYEFFWIGVHKLPGADSYAYIRRAAEVLSGGLSRLNFDNYLQNSLWNDLHADYTNFFVLTLVPFAWGNLFVTDKIFIILFDLILAGAVFFALAGRGRTSTEKRFDLYFAAGVTLFFFFANIGFFLRLTEARPHLFSILFFWLEVFLIFIYRKKPWLLLPLVFIHTWWHISSFIVLVPVLLALFLSKPKDFRPLGYSLLGLGLGLILHPQFPNHAILYFYQIAIPIVYRISPFPIDGAFENKPNWQILPFVTANFGQIVLLGVLVGLFVWSKKAKFSKLEWGSVGLFGIFGALSLVSRRFADYWAVSSVVVLWIFRERIFWGIKGVWGFLGKNWGRRVVALVLAVAVLGALGAGVYWKYFRNDLGGVDYQGNVAANYPEDKGAGEWLAQNALPDSVIYDSAWEEFPMLMFYASHMHFSVGEELGFVYLHDRELLRIYENLRDGKELEQVEGNLIYQPLNKEFKRLLIEKFGAEYAVVKKGRTEKLPDLLKAAGYQPVFEDDRNMVLKI